MNVSTSVSALNAASNRMNLTAHNIAHISNSADSTTDLAREMTDIQQTILISKWY